MEDLLGYLLLLLLLLPMMMMMDGRVEDLRRWTYS